MRREDRKAFAEIVLGFAELKGKQLSAPALQLYWNAMQGWSIEDFRAAAEHLVRTERFFPGPDAFEELRKAGRETPGEAWLEAQNYLRWSVNGYTLDPKCPAPIAKCIRLLGGANVIAMCDSDKLHFLERRFCEHYETIQDSDDVRGSVPAIAYMDAEPARRFNGLHKIGRSIASADGKQDGDS